MAFNPSKNLIPEVYEVFKHGPLAWPAFVRTAVKYGYTDVGRLTDMVFYLHHPERKKPDGDYIPIDPDSQPASVAEWKSFRTLIAPMVPAQKKSVAKEIAEEIAAEREKRDTPRTIYVCQHLNSDGTIAFPETLSQTWSGNNLWSQRWLQISSVAQLVSIVKNVCGSRGYVKTLRIGGHGDETSFRIGLESVTLNNIDAIGSTWIKNIVGYFKPGKSLIYLDNCNVGLNQALLKKVSAHFGGVAVIAPHDNQWSNAGVPRFEGRGTICSTGGCVRVATPNMEQSNLLSLLYSLGDYHPDQKERWSGLGADVE